MVRGGRLSKLICALAIALCAAAGGAAPGLAAGPRVTITGGRVIVEGGGAADDLSLSDGDGRLTISGLPLSAGLFPIACIWNSYSLACPRSAIELRLGAGDDDVDARGVTSAVTIDDGPGDDEIQGGTGDTVFLNGDGDDRFVGHIAGLPVAGGERVAHAHAHPSPASPQPTRPAAGSPRHPPEYGEWRQTLSVGFRADDGATPT